MQKADGMREACGYLGEELAVCLTVSPWCLGLSVPSLEWSVRERLSKGNLTLPQLETSSSQCVQSRSA